MTGKHDDVSITLPKKHATNLDLYGNFREAFLGGGFDPVENK